MDLSGENICSSEFIAFDLETTGLHPVFSRIIEIGAVRFRGDGTVLDQFQQLIDPRCEISAGAMAVNGITNEMVAGQPTIEEVLPVFDQFIGRAPVVMMAHHAAFDIGFLSAAFHRLGRESPEQPVLDTCALSRCRLALANHKLETVGRHLGLIHAAAHRGLDDSLLLKEIFLQLIRVNPAISCIEELNRTAPFMRFERHQEMASKLPPGYEDLWEAMVRDQAVIIEYMGGSRPGSTRVVTPLGVMQSGGNVYLSAVCHSSRINKTFRLDRIASYRQVDRE